MKMLRSLMVAVALAVSATAAQAHDSFNIGINLGSHGYQGAPVVRYHAVPQVIYYDAPRVYRPAPYAHHHAPVIVYRDGFNDGPRHYFPGNGRYHGGHRHGGHFGYHR